MGNSLNNGDKNENNINEEVVKKSIFTIPKGTAGTNLSEEDKSSYMCLLENKKITNEIFEKIIYPTIEKEERRITRLLLKKNNLEFIPKMPEKIKFLDIRGNKLDSYPENYSLTEVDVSENEFKCFSSFPKSSAKNIKLFRCGHNPFQEPHFKDLERFEILEIIHVRNLFNEFFKWFSIDKLFNKLGF
eukprot:TRINITY_DN17853_c0_g1_i1.p1 TRINITY_DN17853_c0_g1~~TRINITY_DN17853_c0_g1_i1.p1  ORF type:complete len:188 (+),score=39.96 TRINITY_DN17853_c0_g1_i1:107-670(+)